LHGCCNSSIRYVIILVLCRGICGTYFQVILTSWIAIVKVSDLVAKVPTWRSPSFGEEQRPFIVLLPFILLNFLAV